MTIPILTVNRKFNNIRRRTNIHHTDTIQYYHYTLGMYMMVGQDVNAHCGYCIGSKRMHPFYPPPLTDADETGEEEEGGEHLEAEHGFRQGDEIEILCVSLLSSTQASL